MSAESGRASRSAHALPEDLPGPPRPWAGPKQACRAPPDPPRDRIYGPFHGTAQGLFLGRSLVSPVDRLWTGNYLKLKDKSCKSGSLSEPLGLGQKARYDALRDPLDCARVRGASPRRFRPTPPWTPGPLGACGRPGAPPCPLQRWMREHAAVAYANRDSAGLATVLEQAASLNPEPERWRKWGTIALAGASRVRRGGPGAALSACVGCHDTYRAEYVKSYRTRRLPAK